MHGAKPIEPDQEVRSRPSPRWHRYAVAGLLVTHAAACWLARPIGYLTGQDDLEYVALGQSLRQGGYNMLFRVDDPVHAQYPPGYPAMLAVWGAVTGDGFDALALLSIVLSVSTLALAYTAARRVFGGTVALAALAVLAVNPELIGAGGNVASEAPFALLTMLVLVLLVSRERSARHAAWAGAAAILAALTRSIGIVLVGAIALHWLMERRWKEVAVFGAASTVLVGSWLLWTVVSPEQHLGSSYVADLQVAVTGGGSRGSLSSQSLSRLIFYATRGGPYALAVPAVPGTPVDNAVSVAILVAGLGAGTWLLLRRWRVAGLHLLLYGGLLMVWTWRSERFLVPLLPIVVPALLAGLSAPWVRRWPRAATVAIAVAALLLVTGGVARTGMTIAERAGCRGWHDMPPAECLTPAQAEYFAALRYMRDSVPVEDVVLAAKPGAVWHYAGNESISYPGSMAQADDHWVPYLREQGARWILLGDVEAGEARRYSRRIEANCAHLELQGRFGEKTYLFRLAEEGQSSHDGNEEAGEACEAVRRYRMAVAATTAP